MSKKSVKLYTPENILESFYDAIRTNTLHKLHIPHSSVFYIRAAIEAGDLDGFAQAFYARQSGEERS